MVKNTFEALRYGGARDKFSRNMSAWIPQVVIPCSNTVKFPFHHTNDARYFVLPLDGAIGLGICLMEQPPTHSRMQLARLFVAALCYPRTSGAMFAYIVLHSDPDPTGVRYPVALVLCAWHPPVDFHMPTSKVTDEEEQTEDGMPYEALFVESLRRMRTVADNVPTGKANGNLFNDARLYPDAFSEMFGTKLSFSLSMAGGGLETLLETVYGGQCQYPQGPQTFVHATSHAAVCQQLGVLPHFTEGQAFFAGLTVDAPSGRHPAADLYVVAGRQVTYHSLLTYRIYNEYHPGITPARLRQAYAETSAMMMYINPAPQISSDDGLQYAAFEGRFGGDAVAGAGCHSLVETRINHFPRGVDLCYMQPTTIQSYFYASPRPAVLSLAPAAVMALTYRTLYTMRQGSDIFHAMVEGADTLLHHMPPQMNIFTDGLQVINDMEGMRYNNIDLFVSAFARIVGLFHKGVGAHWYGYGTHGIGKTQILEALQNLAPAGLCKKGDISTASMRVKMPSGGASVAVWHETPAILNGQHKDKAAAQEAKKSTTAYLDGTVEGASFALRDKDNKLQEDHKEFKIEFTLVACGNDPNRVFEVAINSRIDPFPIISRTLTETALVGGYQGEADVNSAPGRVLSALMHVGMLYIALCRCNIYQDPRILCKELVRQVIAAVRRTFHIGAAPTQREIYRITTVAGTNLVLLAVPAAVAAAATSDPRGRLATTMAEINQRVRDQRLILQAVAAAVDEAPILNGTALRTTWFVMARNTLDALNVADYAKIEAVPQSRWIMLPTSAIQPGSDPGRLNTPALERLFMDHGMPTMDKTCFSMTQHLHAEVFNKHSVLRHIGNSMEIGWSKDAMAAAVTPPQRALAMALNNYSFIVPASIMGDVLDVFPEDLLAQSVMQATITMTVYDALFIGVADMLPATTTVRLAPDAFTYPVVDESSPEVRAISARLLALFPSTTTTEAGGWEVQLNEVNKWYANTAPPGDPSTPDVPGQPRKPIPVHDLSHRDAVVVGVIFNAHVSVMESYLQMHAPGGAYYYYLRMMCLEGPGPSSDGVGVAAQQYTFMPAEAASEDDHQYDDGWAATTGILEVVHQVTGVNVSVVIPKYDDYKPRYVQYQTNPTVLANIYDPTLDPDTPVMASIPALVTALGRHDGEVNATYQRISQSRMERTSEYKCLFSVGATVVERVLRTTELLNGTSLDILHGAICGTVDLFRQFIRTVDSPTARALRGISGATDEPTSIAIPSMAYQEGQRRVPYMVTYNPGSTGSADSIYTHTVSSTPIAAPPTTLPPIAEMPTHGIRDLFSDASNSRFVEEDGGSPPDESVWGDIFDHQDSQEPALTPGPSESASFSAFNRDLAQRASPARKRNASPEPSSDSDAPEQQEKQTKKKKKTLQVARFFTAEAEHSGEGSCGSDGSDVETAADRALIDDGPEVAPVRRRDYFSDSE